MTERVRIAAHAKANLFLRVLSQETTGYHGIETAFTLLDLADEITVEKTSDGIELIVTGMDAGPNEDNLCYRAAQAILDATGRSFGVRIQLEKRIPVRAGLGGGSSDGAATLHAVNHLAGQAVPRHELLQFGARLGSDVPFFVSGVPMALGWNRGERLFRLTPPPEAPALLAVPSFGVSTPEAYRLLDAGGREVRGGVVLESEAFGTWGGIGRLGGNDFESTVFTKEPRLKALFERVAETRPLLVRLSGSGSAVVAVYRTTGQRDEAAMQLDRSDQQVIPTTTRSAPAPGPVDAS